MYWLKLLYPGMNFKRWIILLFLGVLLFSVGIVTVLRNYLQGFFNIVLLFFGEFSKDIYNTSFLTVLGIVCIVLGVAVSGYSVRGLFKSLFTVFLAGREEKFVDAVFTKRRLVKGALVTVIGGGTGLSILLRGIKQITGNCTAVVAVTDDGGSSGRLREELGIIPPGDLRNCITALADTEPVMAKLMQYRFKEGSSLAGHSFGNLFIAAMADSSGDMEKALNETSKILKVRGSVMPSTLQSVTLLAKMSDGSVFEGETNIASAGKKIDKLMLVPEAPVATKSAVDAILNADMLVFGPGSLYTSVITNLLVPGIRDAVLKSKAVKVYICNVMTQPGETDGYTAYDHVKAIYDHVGESFFDFVVVNKQKVSQTLLDKYADKGAYPVTNETEKIMSLGATVVEANLISEENLVRHEPVQLAKTLISMMYRLRLSGRGIKVLDYYFVKDSLKKVRKVFEGD